MSRELIGPKRVRRLVSPFVLALTAMLAFAVQSACGSEDGKKKQRSDHSGGDAGGEPGKGGSKSDGGDNTAQGGAGATTSDTSGTGAESGGGNVVGGAAGAATSNCPQGHADCDSDPDDCETDITLLTSCGACGLSCDDTNGTVICGDKGCEMTSCKAGFGDCNASGTDGCETDLTTADNCGVCQHDCGAGSCLTGGLCAGTQLGSSLAAYRWLQSSDAIYRMYGNSPGYGLPTNYNLLRTPVDGGAEVVMASGNFGVGGLTADDQFVYWAVNGTPPAVLKKAHGAATATNPTPIFEPASLPMQMKIQNGVMYWMAIDGQIYTRALSAAAAEPGTRLVAAADVKGTGVFNLHQDFVVTPTSMYWVLLPASGNQATIRSAGLNGKNVADVAGAITNSFLKLWVNGEDLYWVRATGAALDGAYHFKKGGSIDTLAIQTGLNAILTNGDYFYVLENSADLYRGPISGGVAVKISAGNGLMDFAGVDDTRVYALGAFTHGAGFYPGNKLSAFPK